MKINWNIIGLIFFVKICIFSLIFITFQILPFGKIYHDANFLYSSDKNISVVSAYTTWDAQHFLFLSKNGYHNFSDFNNAFSPLFPFLISVFSYITRNSILSGFLISTISSTIGIYLFYLLVLDWYDKTIAYKSLIFLLAFPTTFFFGLIYSEGIFFMLIMIFFYLLNKKSVFFASLTSFFLPFTRLIGIFIFIPFLSWYIFEFKKMTLYDQVDKIAQKLFEKKALLILSPIIGLIIVCLFFYFSTGNIFAQFSAQKQFVSQYSAFLLLNPFLFVGEFFKFPMALQGFTNSIFDRIFFVGFIAVLFFMRRRVSVTLFVFSVIFGILPVLTGSFMSYTRYVSIVFPMYIVLAKMTEEKRYNFLNFPLLFIFTLFQTFFIVMHSLNHWIA